MFVKKWWRNHKGLFPFYPFIPSTLTCGFNIVISDVFPSWFQIRSGYMLVWVVVVVVVGHGFRLEPPTWFTWFVYGFQFSLYNLQFLVILFYFVFELLLLLLFVAAVVVVCCCCWCYWWWWCKCLLLLSLYCHRMSRNEGRAESPLTDKQYSWSVVTTEWFLLFHVSCFFFGWDGKTSTIHPRFSFNMKHTHTHTRTPFPSSQLFGKFTSIHHHLH